MAVRVLIVDDAMFMRTLLKRILEAKGFNVVGEAENGLEAVKLYSVLKPDIVTMDITMPEVDGIRAVELIKSEDPDANIVMVSAMGQQDMVTRSLQAGAKDFISKPFVKEKALAVIEKHTRHLIK